LSFIREPISWSPTSIRCICLDSIPGPLPGRDRLAHETVPVPQSLFADFFAEEISKAGDFVFA